MTLNQLASAIAKREGKKSQARIGDIREILKIIVEMDAESCMEGEIESEIFNAFSKAISKRSEEMVKKVQRKRK